MSRTCGASGEGYSMLAGGAAASGTDTAAVGHLQDVADEVLVVHGGTRQR